MGGRGRGIQPIRGPIKRVSGSDVPLPPPPSPPGENESGLTCESLFMYLQGICLQWNWPKRLERDLEDSENVSAFYKINSEFIKSVYIL
jgi:hypothetical protein